MCRTYGSHYIISYLINGLKPVVTICGEATPLIVNAKKSIVMGLRIIKGAPTKVKFWKLQLYTIRVIRKNSCNYFSQFALYLFVTMFADILSDWK